MIINSILSEGVLIISFQGSFIDDYSSKEKEILEKIGNEKKVVFDCSEMDYLNSFALRAFLKVAKKVTKEGGQFAFCNIKPNVKEVFQMTGFLTLFQIFSSIPEAIESFEGEK